MAQYIGNGQIKIEPGDTLYGIYGSDWRNLSGYTGDPTKLPTGTVLKAPASMVPAGEKTTAKTTTKKAAATEPLTMEQMQEQFLNSMADLVDSFIVEQDKNLQDIGADYDMEALTQQAIELQRPYVTKELDLLNKALAEGRTISQKDYEDTVARIKTDVEQNLKSLDLQEAKTTEDLQAKLADIGASTNYSIEQANASWKDRKQAEEQGFVNAGLGFSGYAKERAAELNQRQGQDVGEIARTGAYNEATTQRQADYTLDQIKLARETIDKNKTLDLASAAEAQRQAQAKYGTGDLAKLNNLNPSNLSSTGDYSQYGLIGEQQLINLARENEQDIQGKILTLKNSISDATNQGAQDALSLTNLPDINKVKKPSLTAA